jgi:drug/metabolite transporter (DMT)-like permease
VTAASPFRRFLAAAALLLVAISWGATFPLAKQILQSVPPFLYLALRFGIAALLVGALCAPAIMRLRGRQWLEGLLAGIALAGGYAFQTTGLRLASATVAAFLTGLSVLLVPILGTFVGRRASRAEWLGIACGTLGLALLTYRGGFRAGLGEALLLGCSFCFAVHILYLDRVTGRIPSLPLGALQLVGVTLVSGAFSIGERAPRAIEPWVWISIVAMAVVCSALAFTVQAWAQRFTRVSHVGLIFSAEPVAAAVFAWLWLGERLSATQWLGSALIFLGILLAEAGPPAEKSSR